MPLLDTSVLIIDPPGRPRPAVGLVNLAAHDCD